MKTKKIVASVLALTLTTGALALPMAENGIDINVGITASADTSDITTKDEAGNTFTYNFNDDGKTLYLSKFKGKGKVTVPSTVDGYKVTAIGAYAFRKNSSITNIVIEEGIREIYNYYSDGAFEDCTSLTSIKLPSTLRNIGDNTFNNCSSLENVTIPSGVKIIHSFVFYDCTSLKTVKLPNGIIKIDDRAFCGCTSLKTINLPNSIINIDYGAFNGCESLSKISIPQNVKTVGKYSFYGCTNLSSVTIPNGVTTIGNDAFYKCTSLKSIILPKSVTSIGTEAFGWNGYDRIPNFVIKGTKGSAAQTYAKDNGFIFKDVNAKKIAKPTKQTITKVAGVKKGVKVYYKKNTKASGYKIQVCSNSKFKGAKNVVVKSNKTYAKTITGLKSKRKYYVRVLSYKKSGSTIAYGSWSTVKAVVAK